MNESRSDASQDPHLPFLALCCILLLYAILIILAFCKSDIVCPVPLDTEICATCQLPVDECNAQRLKEFKRAVPKKPLMVWWSSVQSERDGLMSFDCTFNCAICLEVVSRSQLIHTIPCRHVFHDQCLENWVLAGHNNCPLCLKSFAQAGFIV